MTATTTTAALAPIQPAFTNAERLALAGFLAGYGGLTREAYALDLRQFTTWCRARTLNLFGIRRADIESFARDLEARGPRSRGKELIMKACVPTAIPRRSAGRESGRYPGLAGASCRCRDPGTGHRAGASGPARSRTASRGRVR